MDNTLKSMSYTGQMQGSLYLWKTSWLLSYVMKKLCWLVFAFILLHLLLLIMYFCIETKINVYCSTVNSFVPKTSKVMVIFTGMFEMDNINSCLMSANLEQCRIFYSTLSNDYLPWPGFLCPHSAIRSCRIVWTRRWPWLGRMSYYKLQRISNIIIVKY
jgi:hypothetical protein